VFHYVESALRLSLHCANTGREIHAASIFRAEVSRTVQSLCIYRFFS
jgi:hypothetical protein